MNYTHTIKDASFPAHISQDGRIQTCLEHSRNTAEYAKRKIQSVGLSCTAYLAGLLHDAGKFTDEFSDYLKRAVSGEKVRKGTVIHSFAGCSYILNKFHTGALEYRDITSEIIAFVIAAHHGLFDHISQDGSSGFKHRLNKQPDYDKKAMDNCSLYIDKEGLTENERNAV